VEKLARTTTALEDDPRAITNLDADTGLSRWSFHAALQAAGSVCEAIDAVLDPSVVTRNAFCAVRPPGHHAGPRGVVTCPNDPSGSHGFCLLNNVAIGAAYAKNVHRQKVGRVAILDFDTHHGNGTQACVEALVPTKVTTSLETPFSSFTIQDDDYKPWLDEKDPENVFFASVHGYGSRDTNYPAQLAGYFYPASGETGTSRGLKPEAEDVEEFLLSQTWASMGKAGITGYDCCKIVNCGLSLPPAGGGVPGMPRWHMREAWRSNILPELEKFNPDLILVSAGFDGHAKDTLNMGYGVMLEEDYTWLTNRVVEVANKCCDGRVVSVLEGGYKIQGGMVSPFARSVQAHVKGLADGAQHRAEFDVAEAEWESNFEKELIMRREAKRQEVLQRQREEAAAAVAAAREAAGEGGGEGRVWRGGTGRGAGPRHRSTTPPWTPR
jgi:acetoin utilization deacetylase AcuC-like enzyme